MLLFEILSHDFSIETGPNNSEIFHDYFGVVQQASFRKESAASLYR